VCTLTLTPSSAASVVKDVLLLKKKKIQGTVFYQVNQGFPQSTCGQEKRKKQSRFPICATGKGSLLCLLAQPLKREPGLPSAPVWSDFSRRDGVSHEWGAVCRGWKQTEGLGGRNLLPGPPRPPGRLMEREPERCRAALLWADLRLHHDCYHHFFGSLQSRVLPQMSQTDVFRAPAGGQSYLTF